MGSSQSMATSPNFSDSPDSPDSHKYRLPPIEKPYMTLDRIIDGNCDFLDSHKEKTLRVGVIHTLPSEPLSGQVICIGDGPPKRLREFSRQGPIAKYMFEGNVLFRVFPCAEDAVCYHLNTRNIDVIREVPSSIRRLYRPMSLDSDELDVIETIFRKK